MKDKTKQLIIKLNKFNIYKKKFNIKKKENKIKLINKKKLYKLKQKKQNKSNSKYIFICFALFYFIAKNVIT